jgi:hypothetical protein
MPPGGPVGGNAQQKVLGPAIGVLVVGVLNALYGVYETFNGLTYDPKQAEAALKIAAAQNPQLKTEQLNMAQSMMPASGANMIIFGLVVLVVAGLTIFGALKMKNLESKALAMTASILAMIPCLSPSACCLFGIGLGIWSLVVLSNAEVKAAFRS